MDLIYKGLVAFILKYTDIKQGNIRQGFQNRVGLPRNSDFCLISFLYANRNMTNLLSENHTLEQTEHNELLTAKLQIDFFGEKALENASKIKLLLRDSIACDFLEEYECQPIDCSELRNHTQETTLQDQYTSRFSFDVEMNYYNMVSIDEPYFNNIKLITKRIN